MLCVGLQTHTLCFALETNKKKSKWERGFLCVPVDLLEVAHIPDPRFKRDLFHHSEMGSEEIIETHVCLLLNLRSGQWHPE